MNLDAGTITLSLTHPYELVNDDYELLFAADINVKSLGLCLYKETDDCEPGGLHFYAAEPIFTTASKNYFRPRQSALLEDGLVLKVLGLDASGNVVASRNIQISLSTSPYALP